MAMLIKSQIRSRRGQGILEVVAMCTVILIPVALLFMDALALVAAKQVSVSSAQRAARAMASEGTFRKALTAWLRDFRRDLRGQSSIVPFMIHVPNFSHLRQRQVGIQTYTIVKLPVPIPGISQYVLLKTASIQPISGVAPSEDLIQFVISYFA